MRIRATLRLLGTDESGRTGPVRSGYRPNHNFGGPDDRVFHIGRVMLADEGMLRPGETGEVTVEFLDATGLALDPGREWRIQEGWRLIGVGTVIEVLN